MSNYTRNLGLEKPATAERNWDVPINANADLLDGLTAIGGLAVRSAEAPSTTLNVRVASGSYRKADGTVGSYAGSDSHAVPASATTCLSLTDPGTLVAGTAFPTTAHVRLARVVAGSASITSVDDARIQCAASGTGLGFVLKSGDTLGDGANLAFGTNVGTQIGTAATQKLGFWGVTPTTRPAASAQAALIDGTGGNTGNSSLGNGRTSTVLVDNSGGVASGTIASTTNMAAMTNQTGGSASTTLAAIADAPTANAIASIAAQLAVQRALNTALINAVASIAARANTLMTDLGTQNDNAAKVARLANQIRTDLVAIGAIKGSA